MAEFERAALLAATLVKASSRRVPCIHGRGCDVEDAKQQRIFRDRNGIIHVRINEPDHTNSARRAIEQVPDHCNSVPRSRHL
eukprot:SAG31_NODE_5061_length_2765_cov_3.097899_3_plen_82_part_00